MPAFASVNEYLNRQGVNLRIRVEVLKDDGTTWFDLTDMVSQDRLSAMPGLTNRQERGIGSTEVALSTIKMDNTDRFWDKLPPTGIASWFRKRIRVSLITAAGVTQLGVWVIEDIDTASDDPTATLTLATLSKRLFDKQADRVKNGRDWYTNRPIGWLVRELLTQEFTRAEVQSWTNVLTRYQVPLANPVNRAVSSYGRPPEFDGTTWREDGTTLYGNPYLVVNTAGAHYGKHWMGIGADLWKWDPDTDTWTKWTTMPTPRANFKIMHLYVNPARGKVIAVAWELDVPSPTTYPAQKGDRSGAKNGDVAVLWADMTTAPATFTEFAGKPSNIYTGHYALRAGRLDSFGNAVAGAPINTSADADCAGINIPCPAGHYSLARYVSGGAGPVYGFNLPHKSAYNSKTDSPDQGNLASSNAAWMIDTAGNYAVAGPGSAGIPLDYRWSMGQFRGAFAHQNAGDEFVCAVVSWDGAGTTYRYRIWKLNTNTGVWTDTTEYVMTGTENLAPLSFQFRSDDIRLLCTGVRFRETAWTAGAPVNGANEPFSSAVMEFTYPLVDSAAPVGRPTQTLIELNTNNVPASFPERYWAIYFDAIYGASDYVLMAGIDVRGILTSNAFGAVTKQISTGNWGPRTYSSGRIAGAVYEAATGMFFVHDAGSNQVRTAPANSVSAGTWNLEDSGFPPVSGDQSLLMGLVLDLKRSAIFGVSGPGSGPQANAEVMGDGPLSGKYYLWQLAGWLTDRVEIADFSGSGENGAMNVKESLEELAAIMDAVFGFDRTGAFYFKARPRPSTMVATLAANGRDDKTRVPDVVFRKRSGSQKLFNVAEMTPGAAVLKPPSGTVRVLARPASFRRQPWGAAPEVFQGNNRNLNLFLRCVQGGLPGAEDDGCVRKTADGKTMVDYSPGGSERVHKLRFAFLTYDTVVETQLLQDIVTAVDTILIPIQAAKDVRGVESGAVVSSHAYENTDEVTIGDLERYTVRSKTDDIANGRSTLRLDRAVPTAWKAGTKLTIRTRGNSRWSDNVSGLTYLVGTGPSTPLGAVSAGTVQTIELLSTRDLAAGMILRVDSGGLEDMRILEVVDSIHVKVRRGVGGPPAVAHATLVPVRAYWAPIVDADFPEGTRFAIGGTGVSLRFADLPDSGDNPFMVGDAIDIVCPGLSLERQDKAKIISYNVPSIEKFGKLPWQNARDSRFAGYRQCIETCKRIVNDFGFPHYDLTAEMPLRWLPDINEGYLAEDLEGCLPRISAAHSPNDDNPPISPDTVAAIATAVEGYAIDVLGDRVSLNLRALNQHVYGSLSAAVIPPPPPPTQQRIDNENNNTLIYQSVSRLVYDSARGKVYVAWAPATTLGGFHNRKILFQSFDAATGTAGSIVAVEAAFTSSDIDSGGIDLCLLSDGTLLCGYGSNGVRVKESTDGGATWPTSSDVDGTFGGATRRLCGFIHNGDEAAGTGASIVDIITQEAAGGGTQDDVYQKRRTGSGTWGSQTKIHDSASGSSPWFRFLVSAVNGARIGRVIDANKAYLVGNYSNALNQSDQVRALYTTNGWTASSTYLIHDYTGASLDRAPIVCGTSAGRQRVMWINSSGGDPVFAYSNDQGATWTEVGSPSNLAAEPWGVNADRFFALDSIDTLYAGAFESPNVHHIFGGSDSLLGWTDVPASGLANIGDSAGAGDGLIVNQTLWRLYSRLNSGHYELWLLTAHT